MLFYSPSTMYHFLTSKYCPRDTPLISLPSSLSVSRVTTHWKRFRNNCSMLNHVYCYCSTQSRVTSEPLRWGQSRLRCVEGVIHITDHKDLVFIKKECKLYY